MWLHGWLGNKRGLGVDKLCVLDAPLQLCINFTNESLHNLFIEHVFKLEQETYIREEVIGMILSRMVLFSSL